MLDLDLIRRATPGTRDVVHLNSAGASLMSTRTLEVVVGHLTLEARIGGYEAAAARQAEIEGTYESLGRLVNGRRSEIALFDNSTHAFNAAVYSIPLRAGDRILTTHAEYGSSILAFLQLRQRYGVEIDIAPNDESGQVDVAALRALLCDRTKLVSISHIPTSGGLINPAQDIGRLVRGTGALYLLDATQSLGQIPVDVESIGADLVIGTGRKFLRGPRGTGFLWAREASLDRLEPFVNEIEASTWDGADGYAWHTGARRFETWEKSYSNVLGLGAAVDEALELGIDTISSRALALSSLLRDGLATIRGVRTHDLGARNGAIVTVSADGVPAPVLARILKDNRINVSLTVPEHNQFDARGPAVHPLVRLSPHYFNSEREIEQAIDVVARAVAQADGES